MKMVRARFFSVICVTVRFGSDHQIRDKEVRRLQKTRKTTAKMGGLCEETSRAI